MNVSPRARAALAVALGAALLGFAPIGVRLSELGPQATALWRFLFALPVLFALAVAARRREGATLTRDEAQGLLAAGVCFGLDIALWHWSLTLTTVANATLLSNMTPILAAAAGWILLKERLSPVAALGGAIGLAGAWVLTQARAQAGAGALEGDLIALGSAVWYAGYLILMRRARRTVGFADAMLVTTLAATVVALSASLAAGEALTPRTAQGWAILAGLGLVVHCGGQGLIALGLGGLPITISTVLLWVQPVAAAALGWALFGEALTALALLGAGLILGGVAIVQRARA